MKKIYSEIWKLAKPYYEKGRPTDIDHIEWMMDEAMFVCEKENLDDSLLLPLVILHDAGYAEVSKDDPFKNNSREAHMKAGGVIAKRILNEVGYSKDKSEKIAHFVSVHDNWAFGENDIYRNDVILGVFNDLDYAWMATPKGFHSLRNILKKTKNEMVEYLENDEKLKLRPFLTKTTEKRFFEYLSEKKLACR